MALGVTFDEVLAAAQANEAWGFTTLYNSLAPAVTAYVRTQGVRDADDVVNEVFLAAFTRIGGFRGNDAQFRSWFFTIAHHRIVDARRAAARAPHLEDLGSVQTAQGPGPSRASAEDAAVSSVELERLRTVLDRLAPDQRDVVTLRVLADLSVEQVAQLLGKSPGAVRQLQHRAVNALRRALADMAVTR